MKARLFLATHAEVQSGMLYAMGIGWTDIGPPPEPFAIAAIIEVPWDETSRHRTLDITIVDADARPLLVSTPNGEQAFQINANFDVGRPPGSQPGRSFNMPVAINLAPLPWKPGTSYVLKLAIDGKIEDEIPFFVRPAPQQPAQS